MHDYKIVRNNFHWLDVTGLLDYLTQMADEGWQLEKWEGSRLIFRPVHPGSICYTLDYFNGKKTDFDWQVANYYTKYQEAGWSFLDKYNDLQLFYSERTTTALVLCTMEQLQQKMVKQKAWRSAIDRRGMFVALINMAMLFFLLSKSYFYLMLSYGVLALTALMVYVICVEVILWIIRQYYIRWLKKGLLEAQAIKKKKQFFSVCCNRLAESSEVVFFVAVCLGWADIFYALHWSLYLLSAALMAVLLVTLNGCLSLVKWRNKKGQIKLASDYVAVVSFVMLFLLCAGEWMIEDCPELFQAEGDSAAQVVVALHQASPYGFNGRVPQISHRQSPLVSSWSCKEQEKMPDKKYNPIVRTTYYLANNEAIAKFIYHAQLNALIERFYSPNDIEDVSTLWQVDDAALIVSSRLLVRSGNQVILLQGWSEETLNSTSFQAEIQARLAL